MVGFIIDFFLPDHMVALEVDGVYWHTLPTSIIRDRRKDTAFRKLGITTLRITDQEISAAPSLSDLVSERLDIITQV